MSRVTICLLFTTIVTGCFEPEQATVCFKPACDVSKLQREIQQLRAQLAQLEPLECIGSRYSTIGTCDLEWSAAPYREKTDLADSEEYPKISKAAPLVLPRVVQKTQQVNKLASILKIEVPELVEPNEEQIKRLKDALHPTFSLLVRCIENAGRTLDISDESSWDEMIPIRLTFSNGVITRVEIQHPDAELVGCIEQRFFSAQHLPNWGGIAFLRFKLKVGVKKYQGLSTKNEEYKPLKINIPKLTGK